MSASVDKELLSHSVLGAPISVGNVSVNVHTGPEFPNQMDELWLYAVNNTANAVIVEVNLLGKVFRVRIPAYEGWWAINPGFLIPNRTIDTAGTGSLATGDFYLYWDVTLVGTIAAGDWIVFDDVIVPQLVTEVGKTEVNDPTTGLPNPALTRHWLKIQTGWPYETVPVISVLKKLASQTVTAVAPGAASVGDIMLSGWTHRLTVV
jgi:hypothetical protein